MEPYKPKEINPKELTEKLISLYQRYIENREDPDFLADVQDFDRFWTGSFLLNTKIEIAANNLVALYVEPKIPFEKAEEILAGLISLRDSDDKSGTSN